MQCLPFLFHVKKKEWKVVCINQRSEKSFSFKFLIYYNCHQLIDAFCTCSLGENLLSWIRILVCPVQRHHSLLSFQTTCCCVLFYFVSRSYRGRKKLFFFKWRCRPVITLLLLLIFTWCKLLEELFTTPQLCYPR